MNDKILLHDCRFQVKVGVSTVEQNVPQELSIDIELVVNAKRAADTDDLHDAVPYDRVHESVATLLKNDQPFHLIETVAERVANEVLQQFEIQQVTVRVRKPGALAQQHVGYAGIEITRKKPMFMSTSHKAKHLR